MSQTAYNQNMPDAIAGMFAQIGGAAVLTRKVGSSSAISAGLAVECYGTADDEISTVSQAVKPLGVSARDTVDPDDNLEYQQGDELQVL